MSTKQTSCQLKDLTLGHLTLDRQITVTTLLATTFIIVRSGADTFWAYNPVEFKKLGGRKLYASLPLLIADLTKR